MRLYPVSSDAIQKEVKAMPFEVVNGECYHECEVTEILYYMVANMNLERRLEWTDEEYLYYTLWNRKDGCYWKFRTPNPVEVY